MVTLKQLRYLDALARHRHFGQAADECAVTQPALSQQIRLLEQELRLQLVERLPRGIRLTEDGLEIARRGGRILTEARDLVDHAHHRAEVLTGSLRLGVIPSIAPYVLPKALPRLQARFPDLALSIRESLTSTLLDELNAGSLDVILVALPIAPTEKELESLTLFEDPFVLAAQAGAYDHAVLTPEAIVAEAPLLLLEEGHCLRDQALAFCRGVRPDMQARFGASSLTTILQMVANGFGVTLLPEMSMSAEVSDPRIELLRFDAPSPKRDVGLVWRRSSPRKADFIALGEVLQGCAVEAQGGDAPAIQAAPLP
ncbi:hydrogen peroxide-inducible genes activator [Amorphus orientalis]|uniref:LysR family hydrogen peroxide-inducible transcriptional activator n=1 Tax=Amorphus orientalis TaxID=649198 RepID=A0AAE4AS37_9HYPH|nr:hydrogen peroxide-inducible genes activator [Amorphus orientalis]MDQ0314682.1 LysR family hydrogen peroxide-inducible transcriptional activator [Amorphus orientalis]